MPKLTQLSRTNLHNQLRILRYNKGNDIHVYRITSNLVPLCTHEVARDWQYQAALADEFRQVGEFVKENNMRVSFHPDHFVNIHSPNAKVRKDSVEILRHHYIQSKAMGFGAEMKFNIHIGGMYGDKVASTERFIDEWGNLPQALQERITLENDDKTYTALETLNVCNKLGVPMVFDLHHHRCNHEDDAAATLPEWIGEVFQTWTRTGLPPKVHVSTPKGTVNAAEFRSHADNVEAVDVLPFLRMAAGITEALDVMVEAKSKDKALFQLMEDLVREPGVHRIDGATLEIDQYAPAFTRV